MSEIGAWRETSNISAPSEDEIQVWRIPLAEQSGTDTRLKEFLCPEEHDRAERFHFIRDQRRFIIRRAALRQLLAVSLRTTPQAVQFELGPHGKPFFPGQIGADGIRFSCSHSGDWALIAVARGSDLGVDLEWNRPMTEAEDLVKNFFSPAEISELANLSPTLKLAGFFNAWTRKEAFVKAIGLGLSYPLNHFSVSLAPDRPVALLEVTDEIDALKRWTLRSLEVAPNYSAALVFEGKQKFLKSFTWMRQAWFL